MPDIKNVISEYIKLDGEKTVLTGICPFCSGKIIVSCDNDYYHCFNCGAGGDSVDFIQRINHCDCIQAAEYLDRPIPKDYEATQKVKEKIYEINREAAKFYYKQLANSRKALKYVQSRCLTSSTLQHFGLGYAPDSGFQLVNYLKKQGYTAAEMIQANLANESKTGHLYDRFYDRIMFPIVDLNNHVVGFGGRILTDEKPKYLNSSNTPVFNKCRNLYGLHFAKDKADGQLILVEGYMDVIALHQAGIENAIATLGTALTVEQAMIIKQSCSEVVVCYDADEPGQRATNRALQILRTQGITTKVLYIPDGKDPDEFIKVHGADELRQLIKLSECELSYKLRKLKENYNMEKPEEKIKYLMMAASIITNKEDVSKIIN